MSNEATPETEETTPVYTYQSAPATIEDKVIGGVVSAIAVGIVGALIWFGIKEDKRLRAEDAKRLQEIQEKRQARIDWMNEEAEKGNMIYELRDGAYLVVPRAADGVRTVVR